MKVVLWCGVDEPHATLPHDIRHGLEICLVIAVEALPMAHGWGKTEEATQEKRNDSSSVDAARERFLARKKKKK